MNIQTEDDFHSLPTRNRDLSEYIRLLTCNVESIVLCSHLGLTESSWPEEMSGMFLSSPIHAI